jgi:hypothetical protein
MRFFAARLANSLLLALLAPLTYFIALRLLSPTPMSDGKSGDESACLAAWTVALYPILLLYPIAIATENLFFPLVLTSFLILLIAREKPTAGNFLLAGFLLGLTALTRSVILPFAVGAIFWIAASLKNKRGALLAALALTLTVLPWAVRNSLLHHRLTGLETSMGYNLYLGYYPGGSGTFLFGPSYDLLTVLDDSERDRIGTSKALEFIRDQPQRFLPLALNRLGYFFGLEKRAILYFYTNDVFGFIPFPSLLTILLLIVTPFVVVSISAAFGLACLRWNPQTSLLLLLFIGYLLPHVLILSEDRFHLALVPFFAILAASAWKAGPQLLVTRWRESISSKLLILFIGIVIALLLLNWGLELSRDADKLAQFFSPFGNMARFAY